MRDWSMLTLNAHGGEISIPGGVEEMVHAPIPTRFFHSVL